MINGYLLAGAAMVFFGIAPIFGKLGLSGVQPLAALTIRSMIISVLLLVTVTVNGQWKLVFEVTAKDAIYIALEGLCAAFLGQLAYYYALKFSDVGRVSPIVAAFPLVAMFLGIIFLGEQVTLYKVLASILIILGVILIKY
jgi:transporter family protein